MTLFQSENELIQSKKEFWAQKMWYNFKFLGCGLTHLALKNFMHPSCQVIGAAPDKCKQSTPNFSTISTLTYIKGKLLFYGCVRTEF